VRADTLTIKALFQKDIRYLIPTFQRPYVWNRDDQWEPLWEDVQHAAERYQDQLATCGGNQAKAEEQAGRHFLGAVVLQQQATASAETETRDVIDGQQRMTTVQLLIDAAQQVFKELEMKVEAQRLSRLVMNAFAADDHRFKLWPTHTDQDSFRAAMTNGASANDFEDSLICRAHEFFRLQVREWIDAEESTEKKAAKAHALEATLFGLLEMVVIDLGTSDDAHVIFETLNARGTPLLASDLVKNYILQRTGIEGANATALYEKHWRDFDGKWWREEVKQGRLLRPRLDVFLNYWLIMRTAQEVPSHDVFPSFRRLVESGSGNMESVVADIQRVGDQFRQFYSSPPSSPEGTFFYRWSAVEAGVSTPLLLWLFSQPPERVDPARRLRCLRAIESFVVRRMLCRMTSKDYNKLFLELIARLAGSSKAADETLINYLSEQTADARLWPDDVLLRDQVLELPLYRLLTRKRLRTVLEAVEDFLRTPKSEEQCVRRGELTVEHLLPQQWQTNWPLPPDRTDDAGARERDRLLHTLGNLTLVNNRLNPALSNAPWIEKRTALQEHSVLHLNKELLAKWDSRDFADDDIRERGSDLAQRLAKIWPAGRDL